MPALPFLALALLLQQGPMGTPSADDFILTDKHAYLVFPPTAVGSPQTSFLDWSPSGRFLLLGRPNVQVTPVFVSGLLQGNRPPEPATLFSVWDRTKSRTVELGSVPQYSPPMQAEGREVGLRWLRGTDVAVDVLATTLPGEPGQETRERADLLRIDAAAGQMQILPLANPIPAGEFFSVYVSDRDSRALISETRFVPKSDPEGKRKSEIMFAIWSLDDKGRMGRRSEPIDGLLRQVRWSPDVSKASIMVVPKAPGKPFWLSFDLTSGKVSPTAPPPSLNEPKKAQTTIQVEKTPGQTAAGAIKRTHTSFWLKSTAPSDQPIYLLSPRADYAALNSTLDSVALLDQGVVTVRALASMPIEMYREAKAAADRSAAINKAKLAAIAAIMYSTDYDDKLPSPSDVNSGCLGPYLKDDAVLSGFTYVFAGGLSTAIENPAATMLGYVTSAGGFAVAFADGHVKWMKDLPKT